MRDFQKDRLEAAREAWFWGWDVTELQGRLFEPDSCADCFAELPSERRNQLFCSDQCRDRAKLARYWREVRQDGRIEREDVRDALMLRAAFMLSGGYPSSERRITNTTRAAVKERDGGRCVQCGAPGTEIDHVAGSSSDLSNLQLLCTGCHRDKTAASLVPATAESQAILKAFERERVLPTVPVLFCDDNVNWEVLESQLRSERIKRLDGVDLEEWFVQGTAAALLPYLAEMRVQHDGDSSDDAEHDDHLAHGEDDDSGYGADSYYSRAMGKDD